MSASPPPQPPQRMLHEQLRAEIALLQLELNQLATANAELRRHAPPVAPAKCDATTLTVAAPPVEALAPRSTNRAVKSGSVVGASAARLCPVVVACDESLVSEPANADDTKSEWSLSAAAQARSDAYTTNSNVVLIHHSPQPVARPAMRDATTGTEALPRAAQVDAARCLTVDADLRQAAEVLASAERVLLGDAAQTACDVAPPPPPMPALESDDAEANAIASFETLERIGAFIADRATELRDTALARQVALSTYLERCAKERDEAARAALSKTAAAEAARDEALEQATAAAVEVQQLQRYARELEDRNVTILRDARERVDAAEAMVEDAVRRADAAQGEVRQLRAAHAELEALLADERGRREAAETQVRTLQAHQQQQQQQQQQQPAHVTTAKRLDMNDDADFSPEVSYRPSVAASGTPSVPRDATSATPSQSARRASTGAASAKHLTSPAPDDTDDADGDDVREASDAASTVSEEDLAAAKQGVELLRAADPIAAATIERLTHQLLRRQHHLAPAAAATTAA